MDIKLDTPIREIQSMIRVQLRRALPIRTVSLLALVSKEVISLPIVYHLSSSQPTFSSLELRHNTLVGISKSA